MAETAKAQHAAGAQSKFFIMLAVIIGAGILHNWLGQPKSFDDALTAVAEKSAEAEFAKHEQAAAAARTAGPQ